MAKRTRVKAESYPVPQDRAGAAELLGQPVERDALRRAVARLLERRRLRAANERLRTMVRTLEACRALAPRLEPGEIHPVVLDLVLGAVGGVRGLSLFRRASVPQ